MSGMPALSQLIFLKRKSGHPELTETRQATAKQSLEQARDATKGPILRPGASSTVRGAAGTQAERQAMRGVRVRGESTGADEEGPHKIGGGRRLRDLPAAVAARCNAVLISRVVTLALANCNRPAEAFVRRRPSPSSSFPKMIGGCTKTMSNMGLGLEAATEPALLHLPPHTNGRLGSGGGMTKVKEQSKIGLKGDGSLSFFLKDNDMHCDCNMVANGSSRFVRTHGRLTGPVTEDIGHGMGQWWLRPSSGSGQAVAGVGDVTIVKPMHAAKNRMWLAKSKRESKALALFGVLRGGPPGR
ncbi:hypothetical protein THAOC_16899 [Thalassiosira oceanica]|uniref:Uncharacterized protein n=1 Tax=Thalassiosira oceanica TaxID=159749 RepID=K0SW33_THAOC|nr:hypothetical protein THAOC_16899 [Thalassiosira oceanica]|eukprot:EJK62487.1 hypothetical protein THAOC_16899 [Thalassiosira oceanica]